LVVALFSALYPSFLRPGNIRNIFLTVAVIGIIAVPMSMLMIAGGVDLSVGALMGFSASFCALLIRASLSPGLAVALTLLAGAAVGLVNGLVVTKVRVNAFIATIGMLSILNGIALVMTSQKGQTATFSGSIGIADKRFGALGLGTVLHIPIQVLFLALAFLLGYLVLNYTQFGRRIFASGAGERVSILSGIDVDRTRMLLFMLTSFAAAFGGVIMASQFLAGHPRIGTGFELLVITAVILGGTAFTGGAGTMQGVLLAILIIGTLRYGMDVVGLGDYYKQIANGAILLLAVGLGQLRARLGVRIRRKE
jgi:ribose/xylose/arabinose/galactoside ABC-type transport system permease subunit